MYKKSFSIFLICCFVSATLPMTAFTAPRCQKADMIEDILLAMKLDVGEIDQSGDLRGLAEKTQLLLDEVLRGLSEDNGNAITQAVLALLTEINLIRTQQLDPQCSTPLIFGVTFAVLLTLGDLADSINSDCSFYYLTNGIADIISDIQSYNICVIDNSPDPDEAVRQQIVRQQVLVELYDFITNALTVVWCEVSFIPGLISLIFDIFSLFPEPPPDAEE